MHSTKRPLNSIVQQVFYKRQLSKLVSELSRCKGMRRVSAAIVILTMVPITASAINDITNTVTVTTGSHDLNIIRNGGVLNVSMDGSATYNYINDGGVLNVSSGGVVDTTEVNDNGVLNVNSGGSVSTTDINSGGRLNVNSGGSAVATTVYSGGFWWYPQGGY